MPRPLACCRWVAERDAYGRTAGSAASLSGFSSDPGEARGVTWWTGGTKFFRLRQRRLGIKCCTPGPGEAIRRRSALLSAHVEARMADHPHSPSCLESHGAIFARCVDDAYRINRCPGPTREANSVPTRQEGIVVHQPTRQILALMRYAVGRRELYGKVCGCWSSTTMPLRRRLGEMPGVGHGRRSQ
jgi:hypothetical protein